MGGAKAQCCVRSAQGRSHTQATMYGPQTSLQALINDPHG
jgi:hypothetical protein